MKTKLQCSAHRHSRGRESVEETREILRNAIRESGTRPPLGSRVSTRFARVGLAQDIAELRGQPARPADLEL